MRNEDEIHQALDADVDRIMLDNFTPERTREAVKLINGRCEIESSGGITLDTLPAYGPTRASKPADYNILNTLSKPADSY